ncbi:hypothetical protein ACG-M12_0040A [Escherichia phage vB_EcoS_ACG-M12]|uniref:Uncharacterized protein n=2 Tax=Guelphvirus TaxID=2732062 RepID=K4FBT5_9CAUD|nr:hypothetical protein D861_gp38 [Escherichia phage vB_EcoS_ACG-M12]AFH19922.1 hypothetical protein ACG-M12_0040A [Escherichia phage vB_EcoS_ACG-M12]UOX39717.1 hypothetical protein [Escherichia phage vB_EcoS_SCS31]
MRSAVAKNVTKESLYMKLRHLTRNHNLLIGDIYWTALPPSHMINPSKANNHRETQNGLLHH